MSFMSFVDFSQFNLRFMSFAINEKRNLFIIKINNKQVSLIYSRIFAAILSEIFFSACKCNRCSSQAHLPPM